MKILESILINLNWSTDELPRPKKPMIFDQMQIPKIKNNSNNIEESNMSTFAFRLNLPSPTVKDVAKRVLSTTVNGVDPPIVISTNAKDANGNYISISDWISPGGEQPPVKGFDVGDSIVATLIDVDGAGNQSPPSASLSFVISDHTPPPQPGNLTVAEQQQIG